MESQPQNPEFMNDPENFRPCNILEQLECVYLHVLAVELVFQPERKNMNQFMCRNWYLSHMHIYGHSLACYFIFCKQVMSMLDLNGVI